MGAGQAGAPDTGLGGADYTGPAVELAFWNGFTGGDGDVIKKIVSDVNAQAKNVKVTINVYQWADLFQKLPAAVTTGRGPDVGALHIDDIPTNAARNIITPIDQVATALKLQESDFSPAVWQGGIYKGQRYGIPLDIHPLAFYWNKDVVSKAGLDPEKPPATKDDYEAALEQMKGKAIQGFWVSPFQFTGGFTFQSILFSPSNLTLPAGLSILQGAFTIDYPVVMAGAAIASIPAIVLFILAQRSIVEGVSRSGLKG